MVGRIQSASARVSRNLMLFRKQQPENLRARVYIFHEGVQVYANTKCDNG